MWLLLLVVFPGWAGFAGPLVIDIGEQPPLFSRTGGIVDTVVERALHTSGYEVAFRWWPIGRMLGRLDEGLSDLYVTPSNTPGQQNPHEFLLAARGVFFYKKSSKEPRSVTQWADLAGKRVGTVIHSPLRPMLEKAGAIVDEGPYEAMFDKLDTGRVDFTATADVGGLLTIAQRFPGKQAEFGFSDFAYSEIQAGLFAVDNPGGLAILAACRRGFDQMKNDGSLTQLLKDFFGAENYRRVKIY